MAEELKPCPFCGGTARLCKSKIYYIFCETCCAETMGSVYKELAIKAWERRPEQIVKVETSFYDQEETFPDCTVQVLTNTATGETSVGWWRNE